MGKGGKYIETRKKRSGKLFMLIAAILILALTGMLLFFKKDGQDKQELQVPTIQTTAASQMHGMLSADDVEWAQASIWKDSAVHLFLTKQQISDIIDAVNATPAENVYVLPNNKNIVLAANQAKHLVEDKEIIVIPTKTVPQGITAIINFMPETDAKANEESMLEAIETVKTGQVTYAVRDTRIDDKEIHEGDIMGIGDKGILAVGKEIDATTKEMLELFEIYKEER